MIKGYKVTDSKMQCRGYQYELGKLFTIDHPIDMCSSGFHYCEKINDCWNYYNFNSDNRVFEIEDTGDTIIGENKNCTNKITFIKELTWFEVLEICNEGKNNTGNRNTGNSNTGDWNTGNSNTGDWNVTDFETGFFNSVQSEFVNVFNKPCKKETWDNCKKPSFIFFNITEWDEEQQKTVAIDYKEAFQQSFKGASKEDIELLKQLPNFDADVFFEISGIRIS